MSAIATLASPLAYLRVRHPLKQVVDLWFPAVGAVASAAALLKWHDFNLFGAAGLTVGVNGLVQILAGFFITSLAAIATFSGSVYRIDEVFDGEKAVLFGDVLTRRRFLCLLYSYLALTSLMLYMAGAASIAAASTLHGEIVGWHRTAIRIVFGSAYFSVLGHILGTTLIGLIFLSGRIPSGDPPKRFVAAPRVRQNGVAEGSSSSTAIAPNRPLT
jgi:hypothetical protein